jgi:DNA-binding NtrC family response regulator
MKTTYKKNNILIIDDDKDVCEMLKKNLTYEGYRVQAVETGRLGVKEVKNGKYDVVILDLKLPDISGEEVLEEIVNIDSHISVIILTAYPSVETAVNTMKNSAVDYIAKPFKVTQLKRLLEKHILKKATSKEYGIKDIEEVGMRLHTIRKKRQISLDVLAKRTNLSKSFLSEVERKKKFPRLSTLKTIARELDVDLSLVFKE